MAAEYPREPSWAPHFWMQKTQADICDKECGEQYAAFHGQQPQTVNRHIIHKGHSTVSWHARRKDRDLPSPLCAPVQYLLWRMTLPAQRAQAEGIVPLGQSNARFVAQQIAMVVGGNR